MWEAVGSAWLKMPSSYAYGSSSGTDLGSGSTGSDDPVNPTYRLMVPIGNITAWVIGAVAGM